MAEATEPDTAAMRVAEALGLEESAVKEYWRRNVRLIIGLFVVWFAVSFLAAILLAEPLSNIQLGRIPLAFWFAQQGSIMVFVVLIFVYAWWMNKLDREYGVHDQIAREPESEVED